MVNENTLDYDTGEEENYNTEADEDNYPTLYGTEGEKELDDDIPLRTFSPGTVFSRFRSIQRLKYCFQISSQYCFLKNYSIYYRACQR